MQIFLIWPLFIVFLSACSMHGKNDFTSANRVGVRAYEHGEDFQEYEDIIEHNGQVDLSVIDDEKIDDEKISPPADDRNYGLYQVQENDTLMLISWRLYGTIHRWRELVRLNGEDLLKSSDLFSTGMKIRYKHPKEVFEINVEGEPYLIGHGDTLKGISGKLYETSNYWNVLFHNNRHLIQDPNIIYAGFTIYYPSDPEQYQKRSLASGAAALQK